MADTKVEGEELKKLVKMGKKRCMHFAFCPGPKNDHIILVDRKKKPEVLGKIAKREGAGNRVAFGTFVLNAKTMELTCERVVPAMGKVLKKYLKTQKILVNVLIMDAEGAVLERDEEELPDDPSFDSGGDNDGDDGGDDGSGNDDVVANDGPTPPKEPAQESADDATKALVGGLVRRAKDMQAAITAAPAGRAARLGKAMALAVSQIKSGDLESAGKTIAAMEQALAKLNQAQTAPESAPAATPEPRALAEQARALRDAIANIGGPAGKKLAAALGNAAQQIKAGNLAAADTLLTRIKAAVAKVGDNNTANMSPEAAKWTSAESRLQPAIDKLIQEKRGDLDAINRAFSFAREQAAAGNYDRAMAAATRAAGLIKQARTETATTTDAVRDAQDAIPKNVVAYTKSRLGWVRTRNGLRKELEGLKSAIDTATTGVEGMQEVPAKSGVLFDYLDGIDSNLEDTLEQLVETPDGDKREGLKTAARKIIDEYRTVLDTDFFQAVDDNGFVSTNIRASALNSLQEVSATLKT